VTDLTYVPTWSGVACECFIVDAFSRIIGDLGRVIVLGLEVLIIADIIRTIVVDQSIESVVVLGTIVLIRVVLSFSLEVRRSDDRRRHFQRELVDHRRITGRVTAPD
jgi:hypothetical protein